MLCSTGRVLTESRNGLIADVEITRISGHAERMAVIELAEGIASASGTRMFAPSKLWIKHPRG